MDLSSTPPLSHKPTGKPHVERQVPFVRENFFRGEQFLGRDHAQREAIRWCLGKAGLRIHGTTRKRPLEVFEAIEKPALKPIVAERFDPPRWGKVKIHPDHHIRFGRALYSAPTRYIGKEIDVRADSRLVRIYCNGELIKTHPVQEPGGRHTDYDDYPKEKTPYAMRNPDYMISLARGRGPNIGVFMTRLLEGDFPWSRLRQAQKLIRLVDKYSAQCPRVCQSPSPRLRLDQRRSSGADRAAWSRSRWRQHGRPPTRPANSFKVPCVSCANPAASPMTQQGGP